MPELPDPTAQIDLSFQRYVSARERSLAARITGGVPDYAFSLDHQLRQKLALIRPVRDLARAMTALIAPRVRQQYLHSAVAVGPSQYPRIHAIGEECARRLGIGIPQIFVARSDELNGFSVATDDIEPVIVLSSGLIKAFEPAELCFIIGHECGHVHNLHGVYNLAAQLITNPLARTLVHSSSSLNLLAGPQLQALVGALEGALRLFFLNWSRCGEITCDRAGLICCGDLRVAQRALAQLLIGDARQLEEFSIDAFLAQLEHDSVPMRFSEFLASHPSIPRRIKALRYFAAGEEFYHWRDDLSPPPIVRTRNEVDRDCERIVSIFTKESRA